MSGKHSHAQDQQHAGHPAIPFLALDAHRMLDMYVVQPLRAEFHYDARSPLAVSLTLILEDGYRLEWRIGRDLIDQGLHTLSGLGDVQIWPSDLDQREILWIELASDGVTALLALPLPPIEEWLTRTYRLVPAGEELTREHWDSFLAELRGEPGDRDNNPPLLSEGSTDQ